MSLSEGSSKRSNPYIGCKISLVSQSGIRYVGTLYSVDDASSNIALMSVRSFGTEDRPVPIPVPPRKDTFQCIIFKVEMGLTCGIRANDEICVFCYGSV